MKTNSRPKIDFEKKLARGHNSYNSKVGQWWRGQAENPAHRRAYKNIARYLAESFNNHKTQPAFFVDYACGDGSILMEMVKAFPRTRFVGFDGSKYMLQLAEQKLQHYGIDARLCRAGQCFNNPGPRIRLVSTILPNFYLPSHCADAAIYAFSNMTCSKRERKRYERHGYNNRKDTQVAELLSRFREMDPEDELGPEDPAECFDDLMIAKVISRNLRQLIKPGGVLARIDYANAPRHELSDLVQWRSLFTEGALDFPIKGRHTDQFFRYFESRYRRSAVIQDVYHQTGDPDDREGGYFCSLFEAI